MSARIAIVSPKQPGTNPRMRKSADALTDAGYGVHVLYGFNTKWADLSDQAIFEKAKWSWQRVGGHPTHEAWSYFMTRLKRKWAQTWENETGSLMPNCADYLRALRHFNPDLVIGHNPGALPVLTAWKKETRKPILFDAEDFHRAESYWSRVNKSHVMAAVEDACIPQVDAMTTASPLISKAYEELYPNQEVVTVNNAFPVNLLQELPKEIYGPLKLVWFSQVLGLDRGLDSFLKGMSLAPDIPIKLTLIGMSTEEKRNALLHGLTSSNHTLQFEEPRPEAQLSALISEHEIGLALERPTPKNRDICRTNKLYIYPLAGCHMLVSETKAQNHFLEEWPQTGTAINLNEPSTISSALTWAWDKREELLDRRKSSWLCAKTELNWESESKPLLKLIERVLS